MIADLTDHRHETALTFSGGNGLAYTRRDQDRQYYEQPLHRHHDEAYRLVAAALVAPDSASDGEEIPEMNEAFAELSPADCTLAEEQKICPVSDQPLGSMGTPIKVSVEGRDIFVCCEGCVEELKRNFDEYAAKIDKRSS